jgi:hypothetical protein
MSTTISPHARIGALVGVLLIALAGSAIFLLRGHSQPAAVTPPVATPQPTPTPTKPVHVAPAPPTVNPLLPASIRFVLGHYPVVVVGFYNPHNPVDMLTIDEARAGALAAHVPFRSVSLLDDTIAGPLTSLLPAGQLLPNPGFVVYKRPGTIAYRSDGYLKAASVEQAVRESR